MKERDFMFPGELLTDTKTQISVAKARRILGVQAKGMTDDQIRELLTVLTLLARDNVLYNGSRKEGSSNVTE